MTFEVAFEAHKQGRLDEAERGYRDVLAADVAHADAWHLLGVIHQQRGQSEYAVKYIQRAVDLAGLQPTFLANLGVALDAAGRCQEAAQVLEQGRILDPNSYLIHFTLGNALHKLGRLDAAIAHYETALLLQSRSASAHNNLGNALRDAARLEDAARHYRLATDIEALHPRAHYNLGVTLKELGLPDQAEASFRTALIITPDMPEAMGDLGVILRRQKRLPEAIGLLEAAAAQKPQNVAFRNNLANALVDAGRFDEAEQHLRIAIVAKPEVPESYYHLGNALKAQNRSDEAVEAYEQALRLRPAFTKPSINLVAELRRLERFDHALEVSNAALIANPSSAELMTVKGIVLQALKREDEALECYLSALMINPNLADAHRNAGLALLMRGRFDKSWESYEWRFRCEGAHPLLRPFPYPEWRGEADKSTILVWGEQGLGDTILFASMIPDLIAQGHSVVMESKPRLIDLFERSFSGIKAVPKENPPHPLTSRSDIRWQTPIGNLGGRLRRNLASFPQRTSYLVADPARRTRYRALLDAEGGTGPVIGISWRSANPKIGSSKTLSLDQWAPILKTPGAHFVDLQYGETADERAAAEAKLGVKITHIPDLDLREEIDGVAALASVCDLVISVSNTTVHLSAALGTPTWIMVPASVGNLWYWMQEGEKTPWYPTVTIFRQKVRGDWSEVLESVQSRLGKFLAEKHQA